MTPLRAATDRITTVRTADGATLRVQTRGPDSAPLTVVLTHGWLLSSDIWHRQVFELAHRAGGEVKTVRFDHRGHGGSTRGTRPMDVDLLANDLAHVLDNHAPSGPLVLGGHCLGGMAIMALAAARPELFADRVRGVLLAATSPRGLDRGRTGVARTAEHGRYTAARLLSHLPAELDLVRGLVPPHVGVPRAAVRRLAFGRAPDPARVRECAELVHRTPAESITSLYEPLTRLDLTEQLDPLRDVAVTVLGGGRDRLVPPRHAQSLTLALPETRVRHLPHSGHMLPVEAPEDVSQELARLCDAETTANAGAA